MWKQMYRFDAVYPNIPITHLYNVDSFSKSPKLNKMVRGHVWAPAQMHFLFCPQWNQWPGQQCSEAVRRVLAWLNVRDRIPAFKNTCHGTTTAGLAECITSERGWVGGKRRLLFSLMDFGHDDIWRKVIERTSSSEENAWTRLLLCHGGWALENKRLAGACQRNCKWKRDYRKNENKIKSCMYVTEQFIDDYSISVKKKNSILKNLRLMGLRNY